MKKIKRIIAVVLLIVVLISGGYLVYTAKKTEGGRCETNGNFITFLIS